MSISRLMHEFRPLFRMLEEPISRSPALFNGFPRSFLEDPFMRPGFSRPAVDVTEENGKYIVEADLPGVRKESIEVRIGDDGRSVTIEGKLRQSSKPSENGTDQATGGSSSAGMYTSTVATDASNQKISTERAYTNNAYFTRTVWLPRPVDTNNVVARLEDGVLKLTVTKADDKGSVVVPVQ
ncbi:HSP20-like chaperone [Pluteus cervinus]|uniref:HSP20-like chaperone n=1 Tax=Pluteus cervinus TaxID=181527 RepID=A0ACD3B9U3_9AGAR|nr:HSP20-like chaperone [Pluteus cervinus]